MSNTQDEATADQRSTATTPSTAARHGSGDSHGHTTAAWTAVIIMLIGFTIAGVTLPLAQEWLFFVGFGVVALGAVVGKVLQMMGLGNTVAYKDERDPEYGDDSSGDDSSGDDRSGADRAGHDRQDTREDVGPTRG
jgi:hypothetical protein